MLDEWALRNSRWKKEIVAWIFEKRNLRSTACLHALCESETRAMRAYGLRNAICIIPNGVELPEVGGQRSEVRDQKSEDIGDGRKVLLYLGRLHPKKGLINLLKAWAAVQRSEVREQSSGEWILSIAGWDQGGHEDELKRLCTELGVAFADVKDQRSEPRNPSSNSELRSSKPPSVVFLGPKFGDAKAACFRNCDAFISPSFSEGLPMVILEAWAYGKPVLMTPQCNLPEGFAANSALRIEPTVESITQCLLDLLHAPRPTLESLGVNGRNLVASRFTWPKIAAEMKSVYDWVLGGGPKPTCVI